MGLQDNDIKHKSDLLGKSHPAASVSQNNTIHVSQQKTDAVNSIKSAAMKSAAQDIGQPVTN